MCQSFQNVALTYEQLADKVTGSKAALFWNADTTITLGKPLIQYYETDWEFLKRISSHLNVKIFADIQASGIGVHVGCDSGREPYEIESLSARIGLSEQYFLHKGRTQREFMYYSIVSEENIPLGRTIKFANKKLIIFKKKVYLDGNKVLFSYDAGGAVFGENPIFFNRDFIGRVIKGEVLSAKNETLRIKMEIDNTQNESEAYDYEWQPESGNVMYCMPQVGTMVSLYFGDWDERAGRIINCIRTNGGDCEDMSDPNNKTLTTEYNKRLMMNEEVLVLNSNIADETASLLSLEDAGGVIVKSKSNLTVLADGLLRIEGKNIIIDTPKKISCGQGVGEDGNTESSLVIEEDVDMVAEEVKYELTVIYLYPNIMDAPEVCDMSGLAGRIALGLLTAVAVGLIVAAFVVFGAAIVAAAGVATAAISASYGTIFLASFVAGSLAGGTTAVMKGIDDNEANQVSDYADYMAPCAVDAGVSALTAGVAAPLNILVKAARWAKGAKILSYLGITAADTNASYLLSKCLLGEIDEIDGGEMLFNTGFSFAFAFAGDIAPLTNSDDVLENGYHALISKSLKNEINVRGRAEELRLLAYGNEASPANLANYLTFLESNGSFFNGTMPEGYFKFWGFVNENAIVSTEVNNILASTASPALAEASFPSNESNSADAVKIEREKYKSEGSNVQITEDEREEKRKEHDESLKERGLEKAEYYICRGAELRCTCGSHMRRLDMNEDDGYRQLVNDGYIHPFVGYKQCVAGEENNIKNFGICTGSIKSDEITLIKDSSRKGGGKDNRINGKRCVPKLLGDVWFDTKNNTYLSGAGEQVTQKSFLACKYGGFIEIDTFGYEYSGENDEGEITKKNK